MKYNLVANYTIDYLKLFYSHVFNQMNRINFVNIDLSKYSREKDKSIFGKYQESYIIKNIDDSESEVFKFESVLDNLKDPIIERSETFNLVRGFADVILFAETVLLYQNDDTKSMWVIKHDDEHVSVCFDFNDTLVECDFKKSAINVKKNEEDILDKILNGDEYVTFVDITVTRGFGNKLVSNFKSILGSNEFNLIDDDYWLMDLLDFNMRRIMINTIHDIKEHIVENCLKINNFTVEDFENGVELWRSRQTKA